MANNNDITTFFGLTGNTDTFTAPRVVRLLQFIGDELGKTGAPATADEGIDWIFEDVTERMTAKEWGRAQDQVSRPPF